MKAELNDMIEYLYALGVEIEQPIERDDGICENMCQKGMSVYHVLYDSGWLHASFKGWDEYSGCPDYPVEGSANAYNSNRRKWAGSVGDARTDLCLHMSAYFEQNADKIIEHCEADYENKVDQYGA